MKRILLIIFLCFIALQGFSQATMWGVYGGAGCATTNNYDVAPSGGLELLFTGHRGGRIFIGTDIFYQNYSLYLDNEVNAAHHETGYTGWTERLNASYAYVTPKFSYGFGRKGNELVKVYVTFGVGYNVSGVDSVRKWDYSNSVNGYYLNPVNTGQYDSIIDKSKNINKLMIRGSIGMTEYLPMGGNWLFTFTEDFGFTAKSLTQTGTPSDGSRTGYSSNGLKPGYISLQIGISHHRFRKND